MEYIYQFQTKAMCRSYSSWIYNYIPVQSVPITTKVHGEVYSIQHYVIQFDSDRFVVFSGYSGVLHQLNWRPRYNWNIIESGVI
jgi:hypothetical protein